MTTNEAIVRSAWLALAGTIDSTDSEPGYCLAWVRQVVEHACGFSGHQLYRDYVTKWVQPEGYDRSNGHWARDAERSLRDLGMAIPEEDAAPGDLVFNWKAAYSERWAAYIGHVGILLEHDLIGENINPAYRPHSLIRGTLAATPKRWWATPTTVIRFDPSKKAR